jgi:hypothetical protein
MTQALERAHGGQWLPQELQARREQLRQAKQRLVQQLERLTDAYLEGVIPLAEYQRRRQDLQQKHDGLEAQENQMDSQIDRHHELAGLVAHVEGFCQRVQAGLAVASFEQKRQLVELLCCRFDHRFYNITVHLDNQKLASGIFPNLNLTWIAALSSFSRSRVNQWGFQGAVSLPPESLIWRRDTRTPCVD